MRLVLLSELPRSRRRLVEFFVERLQHASGFLTARHAKVKTRFVFVGDCVGIVVAIVAALAAILLCHGSHHAPAQRPSLGKLHALGNRHGLVVPWCLTIVAVA